MRKVWTDVEGKRHYIHKMDEEHITNCVRLIKKRHRNALISRQHLLKESIEHSPWSYSSNRIRLDRMIREGIIGKDREFLDAFKAELERRDDES